MFCQFLLYSKVTQLYIIYICTFFFSRDWLQFLVLYSRTLLFIHSKCNGLYLLTPNSQSILPSPLPFGNHKSVFYVYGCVSISQIRSFQSHFLDSTYKLNHTVFVFPFQYQNLFNLLLRYLIIELFFEVAFPRTYISQKKHFVKHILKTPFLEFPGGLAG